MSVPISVLTQVLGRRETFKYVSIAAVGAMIAPLTGCAGSTLAFSKFAAGTWTVDLPAKRAEGRDISAVASVTKDGTWTLRTTYKGEETIQTGTWTMSGTTVDIAADEQDDTWFIDSKDKAAASGVPNEVDLKDLSELPQTFTWSWNRDSFNVGAQWDKKSKTLTMTGYVEREAYPIVLTKTSDKPEA